MALPAHEPITIKPEVSSFAVPLDIQNVQHALRIEPFLEYVEQILGHHEPEEKPIVSTSEACNGIFSSATENRTDKSRLYNVGQVKKGRKWLKNILLSDTSSSDDDDDEGDEIPDISAVDIKEMLRLHVNEKKHKKSYYVDKEAQQFAYYSTGLMSNYDKFSEKSLMANKAKKEQRKFERKLKKIEKLKKVKEEDSDSEDDYPREYAEFRYLVLNNKPGAIGRPSKKDKKMSAEQMASKRHKVWVAIAKKEIPKAQKMKANTRKEILSQLKKVAKESQKDCRKQALQSQKVMKEAQIRARRLCKEMQVYWKRFDKVEKEHRKKAEKEALEQRKVDVELSEMKRQQRKLNFLITQTELYAHFMARKMTGATESEKDAILSRLEEDDPTSEKVVESKGLVDLHGDNYSCEDAKQTALRTAARAYDKHKQKTFGTTPDAESELANPTISTDAERPQPSIFEGKLKGYQLKGMNWLANLYEQGINGILADEMGLGKTVQSVALLSYLAETLGIWGPFLIVSPASTLHNWQQELSRFTPKFKIVPYWGNTQDRKVLRKFWNQENLHSPDASFHVVVTSYQLVIQDVKYFSRIKWHYMILDEAQAIKSQTSVRWKILLDFNCRNRLLLTGTPIQNTMQELWALLHFIMPTLFDSHDEFNEWFSKDIESHAEKQSGISEKDLSRLHMILKPFMLRRIKKDVENELSDKIEILVYCPLTVRQKLLYQAVKNKIRIEDLLQSGTSSSTSSLMNLVMQFRKVCNHPELFERKEVRSPFYMKLQPYIVPKLVFREALLDQPFPSKQHLLFNKLYIFNSNHVHSSLFSQQTKDNHSSQSHSCFSFTRFINVSPAELQSTMLSGLLISIPIVRRLYFGKESMLTEFFMQMFAQFIEVRRMLEDPIWIEMVDTIRWLGIFLWFKEAHRIHHQYTWQSEYGIKSEHFTKSDFLLQPLQTTYFPSVQTSQYLQQLVFTNPCSSTYGHVTWTLHSVPETIGHRKIRLRRLLGRMGAASAEPKEGLMSPTKKASLITSPRSPHKVPMSPTKHNSEFFFDEENIFPHRKLPPQEFELMLTNTPSFLYHIMSKTMAMSLDQHCSDRSAAWNHMAEKLCGTPDALHSLLYGTPEIYKQSLHSKGCFCPTTPEGLYFLTPKYGYSGIFIPDKETLITDAGKLYVLDTLLNRLKCEGHRVLIYSQMTRMIDILEEYMWHRKHTYMRLDGSSKISDRRDMVADFQTRADIFVFLLSTRAGGLGINLTAADTVIFYDSDWNPTVDQQAMDRAHRLGQTKQVTVYRLICKGTIEERILERAKEKSEIQKMVIMGGNYKPDVLRPKEVVSLLLDDDEIEKKLKQKGLDEEKPGTSSFLGMKRKQPSKGGRGPGRPKRKKEEEGDNVTIKEIIVDDFGDTSQPPSPYSGLSEVIDESSNDASQLVVDDIFPVTPSGSKSKPFGKQSPGSSSKPRGRPKGSGGGVGRRRGRGSVQKALSAAEAAAAQVGLSKGYAAYGYSMGGNGDSSGPSTSINTPPGVTLPRSGSRGRGRTTSQRPGGTPKRSPKTPH